MSERHDLIMDLNFPDDTQTDEILWLSWPEGQEGSGHVFDHGTCSHCGITELTRWRVHGGRHKDLCLARTKLGRDWAMMFHDGRAFDPTGRILIYVALAAVESLAQNANMPKRLAWIQLVEYRDRKCVLILSGYPGQGFMKRVGS